MLDNQTTISSKLGIFIWAPLFLMVSVSIIGAQFNYLLFHTIAELLSIIIAITAMIVASQSKTFTNNNFVVYLATVIGWCAGLDFIHTLVFKGMNLLQSDEANPSTQLWIAARGLQAGAMLFAPLMLKRHISLGLINVVLGSITIALIVLIFTGYFPDMYIEGKGLTALKIYSEYVIIFAFTVTLIVFWIERENIPKRLLVYLSLSMVASILSEFAFTKYVSVYATANLIGHLLKICAYWFIYLGLVETTLTEPFSLLSRSSSTFDSVPDATIITGKDGKVIQSNIAAGILINTPVASLVDKSSHELFHDPDILSNECVICKRLTAGETAFTEEIRFSKKDQIFECSVAPFISDFSQHASVQVFRDITERDHAIREIKDLTYLYEMLSATNRAIVHSNTAEELLSSIFDAVVKGNAFPYLFVAIKDNHQAPLKIVHAHGFSIDRLSDLTQSIGNPASPLGQVIHNLKFGVVEYFDLPAIKDHDNWINYLKEQGITSRAFMPLSSETELFGVIVLYTRDPSIFDVQQLKLLNQMAADASYALSGIQGKKLKLEAEATAKISENRFTSIFENNPTPLMIVDSNTHQVLKINESLYQWMGYSHEEIPDEKSWLDRVCSSDKEKKWLTDTFSEAVTNFIKEQKAQLSPIFTLRAKDGSFRIAQAAITIIENEIVISWSDLTEIRKKDQALLETASHFHNMIEQSVTGMYVRRDGKYIYSNPRYSEITGWSKEELENRDVLDFTSPDPENVSKIHKAWDDLEHGLNNVTYSIPFRHKDGHMIELELHAKIIDWDGVPAHIVLADDITEKKAQQDKINDYVVRLEESMKGTLNAVANMVEMRDPYTAGHERRVGLIARDIALEMGWDKEKAKSLELIGLVHDIGKIAIPAEILVKPSRLSTLEMELVKGHVNAGYDILKNIPFPVPVAEIIRQHHERMDGSGYPQGLKEDEITPEAKILAVADVIESMATHRPYRPALGIKVALEEILSGSGVKFDKQVCQAVKSLIDDKNYQLPS